MIRWMTYQDKKQVMHIIRDTHMFMVSEIDVAEELIDIYLQEPKQKEYQIIVIENNEKKVVGYLCYGPTPMTDSTFDLYWMAVAPHEQGHGYGKKLVFWLENKINEIKGRLIIIETSSLPIYEGTRQFYLRLNYKECARIADFYKPGDDRVIYVKYFF